MRLGAAWVEISGHLRLWRHANVSVKRKLEVFQSVITSKVMYALNSAWLNQTSRKRLDGFQAKCLRKILNIPHAFLSRVSNATVLERSGQLAYTQQLLKAQILLFGKIAQSPDTDPPRRITFQPGSIKALTDAVPRKVGRPRNEWTRCLLRKMLPNFPSENALHMATLCQESWKAFATQFASVPEDSREWL